VTLEEDLAAWVADRTDWQKDAIARFCRNESFSAEDITEIVDKLVAGTTHQRLGSLRGMYRVHPTVASQSRSKPSQALSESTPCFRVNV
jgi:hypothetical protein